MRNYAIAQIRKYADKTINNNNNMKEHRKARIKKDWLRRSSGGCGAGYRAACVSGRD